MCVCSMYSMRAFTLQTLLSFEVSLCVYVCFAMCVCGLFFFFFAVGSLSGLQVLKSMRFNTSSNLTLSDTALKP